MLKSKDKPFKIKCSFAKEELNLESIAFGFSKFLAFHAAMEARVAVTQGDLGVLIEIQADIVNLGKLARNLGSDKGKSLLVSIN